MSEENAECLSLAIDLKQLKKDFKKVNTELKIRLAKLCPHNFFNKRINWQKQINKKLISKIKLLPCAASTLKEENVKPKKILTVHARIKLNLANQTHI